MTTHHRLPIIIAVLMGLTVGWMDVSATEVQGTLLFLMLAAFAITLLSSAKPIVVAIATAVGLPITAMISRAAIGRGEPQIAMLLAVLPTLGAAYGGRWMRSTISRGAQALASDDGVTPSREAWDRSAISAPLLLGGALAGCALVGVLPVYATLAARGQPAMWWVTIWWQIVSFVAWALASPVLLRAWTRSRAAASGVTLREIGAHSAIVAGIAALHAIALPLITRALFVPLGAGGISSAIGWAFAAYLALDALTYALVIGLGHASDTNRRAHAAANREAAARGALALATLSALRAQLQPHFLFNALNAAMVLARRGDSQATWRVLAGLADLLRYVLREDGESAMHVPLSDEIAFAENYLAIERERFPDRLRTSVSVSPEVRSACVPHLLLQPLVENAVQHGAGGTIGECTVTIRAWREGDTLHLAVDDDGPGPGSSGENSTGIGLANTRARLATLFGDRASFSLSENARGGATAQITLPYRQ